MSERVFCEDCLHCWDATELRPPCHAAPLQRKSYVCRELQGFELDVAAGVLDGQHLGRDGFEFCDRKNADGCCGQFAEKNTGDKGEAEGKRRAAADATGCPVGEKGEEGPVGEGEPIDKPRSTRLTASRTETHFNDFRDLRGGPDILRAYQWWPGKVLSAMDTGGLVEGFQPGEWLIVSGLTDDPTDSPFSCSEEHFRAMYDPLHPERKRLQELCDKANGLPGEWYSKEQYTVAYGMIAGLCGSIVCVAGRFYVEDRDSE